ncbi:DUF3905 domain-containing protein [Bacillus aquiflavi]|uniref:DUF3905 domain-containing protein n=1 Tax=Bacillus aquiflavi TaxID=2672567 RepID=A0A6B3W0X1_9BACI|nr:DUF3905 domain-containing protein [Bacillus aquiflavi]MBA4537356.1 DUF3905 domain-containing protein [Bacillus aquiflavi]NEY81613.1 DUF3905 domain-containing protein [Bacillus aquiflavi]
MMKKQKQQNPLSVNETLPHQINAPSFKDTGIKMEAPYKNSFGVTIGDSKYASENSPLENWNDEVDPSVMAGDEWVHPTNDIGWNSAENRELLEQKRRPKGSPFMHPTKDVSYGKD